MLRKQLFLSLIIAIPMITSAGGGLTAEECLALYKQDMEKCRKQYEYDEAGRRECEQRAMNSFAECLKDSMGQAERTFSVIKEFFDLHDGTEGPVDRDGGNDDVGGFGFADVDESVREKCRGQAETYRKKCVDSGKSEEVCLDEAYKEYLRCLANNR